MLNKITKSFKSEARGYTIKKYSVGNQCDNNCGIAVVSNAIAIAENPKNPKFDSTLGTKEGSKKAANIFQYMVDEKIDKQNATLKNERIIKQEKKSREYLGGIGFNAKGINKIIKVTDPEVLGSLISIVESGTGNNRQKRDEIIDSIKAQLEHDSIDRQPVKGKTKASPNEVNKSLENSKKTLEEIKVTFAGNQSRKSSDSKTHGNQRRNSIGNVINVK
jgi:hypothetical protein